MTDAKRIDLDRATPVLVSWGEVQV